MNQYRTNVVSEVMNRPCYGDAVQYMEDHNMTSEEFKKEFDPDVRRGNKEQNDRRRYERRLYQSRDRQARLICRVI